MVEFEIKLLMIKGCELGIVKGFGPKASVEYDSCGWTAGIVRLESPFCVPMYAIPLR